MANPQHLKIWIEALEAEVEKDEDKFTEWELDFIKNVSQRFKNQGWLSPGQEEKLETIYAKKTS